MNWYKIAQQQYLWDNDTELPYANMSKLNIEYWNSRYPPASSMVDGLTVLNTVPNTGSISSSLEDYYTLPNIRQVLMSDLSFNGYAALDDYNRVRKLVEQIKVSKEISPLIIVIDDQGPYILEGGHRGEALNLLGKKEFPALVVLDTSDINVKENNELV